VVLIKTESKVIDFTIKINYKLAKHLDTVRNLIIKKTFINFFILKNNTMINIRPDEISSIIRRN
jgi:hypothetical protein